jgi:hypothetical protein
VTEQLEQAGRQTAFDMEFRDRSRANICSPTQQSLAIYSSCQSSSLAVFSHFSRALGPFSLRLQDADYATPNSDWVSRFLGNDDKNPSLSSSFHIADQYLLLINMFRGFFAFQIERTREKPGQSLVAVGFNASQTSKALDVA